jgi:O-antigen ligase
VVKRLSSSPKSPLPEPKNGCFLAVLIATFKFNAAVTNATQFVDNEDGNKKQPSGTASERFIFWKVAINTARKHPFFGSGSGDFGLELKRFTTAYPQYNVIGDTYRSAHNIFFEWLALFGIIGFLALMVSVFLLPLKFFFQTIKNNPLYLLKITTLYGA